jgi:hypothetical protein
LALLLWSTKNHGQTKRKTRLLQALYCAQQKYMNKEKDIAVVGSPLMEGQTERKIR